MLNIFTEQNFTDFILPKEKRNQLESDIPVNFEELENTFTEIQAEKNQLRNRLMPDDSGATTKIRPAGNKGSNNSAAMAEKKKSTHIVNWISKTAGLEELRQLNPEMDFRLVRCLKSPPVPLSLTEIQKAVELELKKGLRDSRQ